MRRIAKVDANQKEVTKAFRDCGFSVLPLHMMGAGCPDLLIARLSRDGSTRSALVEVKDGAKVPSKQTLTDDEIQFHKKWRGTIYIVRSIDDVLTIARNF